MRRQPIKLHIEELVLEGFAPGDCHRIRDALQAELTRLFEQHGIPKSLAEPKQLEQMNGPSFRVGRGSSPKRIGAEAAQAVYRGFHR